MVHLFLRKVASHCEHSLLPRLCAQRLKHIQAPQIPVMIADYRLNHNKASKKKKEKKGGGEKTKGRYLMKKI